MSLILIKLSILLILLLMSVQDFKYRAISWYAFPALAAFMLLTNPLFNYIEIGMNLGFMLLNYFSATLILSLKYRKFVNLMEAHIGWGDVLMLICLALYFPAFSFFLFYLSSLILIAAGAGLYLVWRKPQDFTVPLAGLQSALLMVLIITTWATGWQVPQIEDLL